MISLLKIVQTVTKNAVIEQVVVTFYRYMKSSIDSPDSLVVSEPDCKSEKE